MLKTSKWSFGLMLLAASTLSAQNPPQQGPPPDSLQASRDSAMNAVLKQIAGKEQMRAGDVFQNVTEMGDVPAERFLRIMNLGYSRSLGVTCSHCHTAGDFGSDDKQEKATARAMIKLVATIGNELRAIKTIKSEQPFVNCSTCHNGRARPGVRPGAGN